MTDLLILIGTLLGLLALGVPVAFGIGIATTAAMLVPALYEFDIAMGRTKTAEEE